MLNFNQSYNEGLPKRQILENLKSMYNFDYADLLFVREEGDDLNKMVMKCANIPRHERNIIINNYKKLLNECNAYAFHNTRLMEKNIDNIILIKNNLNKILEVVKKYNIERNTIINLLYLFLNHDALTDKIESCEINESGIILIKCVDPDTNEHTVINTNLKI